MPPPSLAAVVPRSMKCAINMCNNRLALEACRQQKEFPASSGYNTQRSNYALVTTKRLVKH